MCFRAITRINFVHVDIASVHARNIEKLGVAWGQANSTVQWGRPGLSLGSFLTRCLG